MCLPTTVRRSTNGRLMYVHERPLPARPVPVPEASEKEPTTPKDDAYADPFAGLSLSSPSSSDEIVSSAKITVKPEAQATVKQANKKQPSPTRNPAGEETKKQTETIRKKTKTAPLPATHTVEPAQAPTQREPRTLERRVSFPDQLTRGRGRSYTPSPSDGKAVRFSPFLVCGEGSSLSASNFAVHPFTHNPKGSAKPSQNTSQASPHRVSKPNGKEPVFTEGLESVSMGTKELSRMRDQQADSEIASDSDDSFTDVIVVPAKPDKDSKSHRRDASPRYGHHPAVATASNRFPRYMHAPSTARQLGYQSEIGDHDSYIDAVTTENTRRNSTGSRLSSTSTTGFHNLDASTYQSWPGPVFVYKGNTPLAVAGRQSPVFVLRDRSKSKINVDASGKRAAANSSSKQAKWRYQPPSVDDEDVNDKVYWDQARKRKTRDI
ncbi:MAG: hypothetical protein LQ346_000565 [Caloplaca aetnensis]|nr:MAG: hypothetical protein LQ346_000565 [Caloplaca aetnensis]